MQEQDSNLGISFYSNDQYSQESIELSQSHFQDEKSEQHFKILYNVFQKELKGIAKILILMNDLLECRTAKQQQFQNYTRQINSLNIAQAQKEWFFTASELAKKEKINTNIRIQSMEEYKKQLEGKMEQMCTMEGYAYEGGYSEVELMKGREWSELIFLVENSINNVWKNLNFILQAEKINIPPNIKAEFLKPVQSIFNIQNILVAEVYAKHPDFVPSGLDFQQLMKESNRQEVIWLLSEESRRVQRKLLQEIAFIKLSVIQSAQFLKIFLEAIRYNYRGEVTNTFMRNYAQAEKNTVQFESNMAETSTRLTRLGSICEQLRISWMRRK